MNISLSGVQNVKFNNTDIDIVKFNGTEVWRKSRLPSGYQEVEWIDNGNADANSFVNTKIFPNIYDIGEAKVELITLTTNSYIPILSAYQHAYTLYGNSSAVGEFTPYYNWHTYMAASNFSGTKILYANNPFVISSWSQSGNIYSHATDGTNTGESWNYLAAADIAYTESTTPYAIWGRANSGSTTSSMTVAYPIRARIYYLKLWRGNANGEKGQLVLDLVPCIRTSDNKAGFFDLVSREFMGCSGSGTFITYINQVPISTDGNGAIYNTVGYKDGFRLNSSYGESSASGSAVTGFIPFDKTKTLRIKGITINDTTAMYVEFFDSSKVGRYWVSAKSSADSYGSPEVQFKQIQPVTDNHGDFVIWDGANQVGNEWLTLTNGTELDNIEYVRISGTCSGANMIVTIDQDIV